MGFEVHLWLHGLGDAPLLLSGMISAGVQGQPAPLLTWRGSKCSMMNQHSYETARMDQLSRL